ncbi:IS607 family transposase [archaeon]|nr:IS607 family transposase [archaeon]NCQ51376.1 IS607 family transposase [archaeon]NCT58798.1 IS607 family transposase [archaeon]
MTNEKLYTLSDVAKLLNVHQDTLRLWDKSGKLVSIRTKGGHRRYKESVVHEMMNIIKEPEVISNVICIYCRVSSNEQKTKGDLERQKQRLYEYCIQKKYIVEYIFEEVGSGLNDKRPKLLKMMDLAKERKITKIVIEHKDRLIRFNKNILIKYFESHGVTVEWSQETLELSYQNELVEDMLSLIASFSSKLYGKRSAENRKIKKREL